MSSQGQTLILGCVLKEYLTRAEAARKRPLQVGEFFCLSCKCARPPALAIVDYVALSASRGRLRAFCADCERTCIRMVCEAALPAWRETIQVGGNVSGTT